MGRIVSIIVMLMVVVVAAAYITDMPTLRPVRVLTDSIIGKLPRPAKSIANCSECEASCAGQFEKCKVTRCNASEKEEVLKNCVERCADQYRGCYFRCAGKYGKEECPSQSIY